MQKHETVAIAVTHEPGPALSAIWAKNPMPETSDHINQVNE